MFNKFQLGTQPADFLRWRKTIRTVPGGPGGRDPLAAHKYMISGACAHRGGLLGRSEKISWLWKKLGGPTSTVFSRFSAANCLYFSCRSIYRSVLCWHHGSEVLGLITSMVLLQLSALSAPFSPRRVRKQAPGRPKPLFPYNTGDTHPERFKPTQRNHLPSPKIWFNIISDTYNTLQYLLQLK